jgi:hypothetical protein
MRERFNRGMYWERMKAGEFTAVVRKPGKPQPEILAQWPTAISQSVSYLDSMNNEIARVHQYVLPDGTIVASGRPDPKLLYEDGVLYHLVKDSKKAVKP